jgi:UDP-N-acetylglucosamine 2-epimerase (non-hydrolysing)
VVFPLHPRTRQALRTIDGGPRGNGRLRLLEPVSYLEMLGLVSSAALVVTDSGVQEETSYLGIRA